MAGGNGLFECEQVERARRYHRPLYLAAAGAIALNLGVLALLTFSVLGDHVYAATSGWAWWARVLAFTLLVLTLTALVGSPIAFWAGYVHEHAWSLSTQSAGGWFLDRMKGLAVNLVLGAGALLGIAAAARAWPALWPAIVAAAAAAFVLILSFVAPVILEPLFSRFTSLTDLELAGSLRSLADRAGLPVQRILVADASRRTRKLNAYVSGDPAGSGEEAPDKADTKEVQSGHRPCVGCLEREPCAIECGRHEGESHAEEKASH